MAAVKSTQSYFDGIEEVSEDDNTIFLKLLDGNSALFNILPEDVKPRVDGAMACLKSDTLTEETAVNILLYHPHLTSDVELMTTMAEKCFHCVLQKAPESLNDHKNLMLTAVSAAATSSFSICSDCLQHDPEIIAAVVRNDPDFAFTLSKELLKEDPKDCRSCHPNVQRR